MLRNKSTFSLTILVMCLAFGLAFYVPTAMADHGNFGVSIRASEDMEDVSSDDGVQIESGRHRDSTPNRVPSEDIQLIITTDQIVNLAGPELGVDDGDLVGRGDELTQILNKVLDVTDLIVDAYDADGRSLGILPRTPETGADADVVQLAHRDPRNPGKEFLVTIDSSELTDAYTAARGGGTTLEIHTLLFSIRRHKMERADEAYVTAVRNDPEGDHAISQNNAAGVYKLELVDADQGNPRYTSRDTATQIAAGSGMADAGSGTPGVVSVNRAAARIGYIETGPFDVRVLLTEEPRGENGLTADHISVTNGSVTSVAKGLTIDGGDLTTEMVTYYASTDGTAAPTAVGNDDLPQTTGRDNKYHQYFVTITPNPALTNADVVVSINRFSDKVEPAADTQDYIPLTANEMVKRAPTAVGARDARVMNESVTVTVTTGADTTSAKGLAQVAYDTRKALLEGNTVTNEKILDKRIVVPADGYLILVADPAKAGIPASTAKPADKEKLLPALQRYNTHSLGLPFPANDLENFFRNGGALNLGYADIPEATAAATGDSVHDDAKANADTGYDGATTNAYSAGALVINEIMWGLDRNLTESQYIELKNTTGAELGIDSMEWVITVGALPPGYTLIDTVNNNPASGFWEVPGQPGVTVRDANYNTTVELVSMSRVNGAPDGSMRSSWARSILSGSMVEETYVKVVGTSGPTNLSGRRVGTPGSENNYAVPPLAPPQTMDDDEEDMMDDPPAPPAEADDIRISEIMVVSNDGSLPQWIELANRSGAPVSLTGWSLVVENDPVDDENHLVGATVEVSLGDVEIGVDQVALVVTKVGRNSGIGDSEGDLRADRIIDVQDAVSPNAVRYSLISEMGFMLTLMPPQKSAVREPGDMVGNLGKGWDIPMAEEGRSSIVRRETNKKPQKDIAATMDYPGTTEAGWMLADDTTLEGAYRSTYYGDDDDVGTPGYDAGGALPVELSMFYAKRDPMSGAVVITWETESELNNAGFFIKRSETQNGTFVVVNPTLIAGAGTISEKQSYTYVDGTAKPNIVYYYQIEDVSLDGNRQTLTRAHRLRGHVGAAGKATTTWGELKEQY